MTSSSAIFQGTFVNVVLLFFSDIQGLFMICFLFVYLSLKGFLLMFFSFICYSKDCLGGLSMFGHVSCNAALVEVIRITPGNRNN